MDSLARIQGELGIKEGVARGWLRGASDNGRDESVKIHDQNGVLLGAAALFPDSDPVSRAGYFRFSWVLNSRCFGRGDLVLVASFAGVRFAEVDCCLDLIGHVDTLTSRRAVGWLGSRSAPNVILVIEILRDGCVVGSGPCGSPREDVRALFPELWRVGFNIMFRDPVLAELDSSTYTFRLAGTETPAFNAPVIPNGTEAPRRRGQIEYYGFHAAEAWVFVGAIHMSDHPGEYSTGVRVRCLFGSDALSGLGDVAFFDEPRQSPAQCRFVIYLRSTTDFRSDLGGIEIYDGELTFEFGAPPQCRRLAPAKIGQRALDELLDSSLASGISPSLLTGLRREAFTGQTTLSDLSNEVRLDVDSVIRCPDVGFIVIGWLIGDVEVDCQVRVHAGGRVAVMSRSNMIGVPRPDVVSAFGLIDGHSQCGFVTLLYVPTPDGDHPYLSAETRSGRIGFKPLLPLRRTMSESIKLLLREVGPQYISDIPRAFDAVIGPAVRALNAAFSGPRLDRVTLGVVPPSPRYSLVVAPTERVDLLEYQIAALSRSGLADAELVCICDDPRTRRERELLAHSIQQRFEVALRLIFVDEATSFSRANNIGLGEVAGEFVCFLNAAVAPDTRAWLARLAGRLDADSDLGAIGPILLDSAGAIHSAGLQPDTSSERHARPVPSHLDRGMKPAMLTGLLSRTAVAGECIMLRRTDAIRLGGFSEDYLTEEFVDIDLCRRLSEVGLACAVEFGVKAIYTTPSSGGDALPQWKTNATLYDAWVYRTRWPDLE